MSKEVVEQLAWNARVEKGRQRRLKLSWLFEDLEHWLFEAHPVMAVTILVIGITVVDVVGHIIHI